MRSRLPGGATSSPKSQAKGESIHSSLSDLSGGASPAKKANGELVAYFSGTTFLCSKNLLTRKTD